MATKVQEGDDLEYHVTFPTPKPGSDQSTEYNSIEYLLHKKETAVLLVGWQDCSDKYLAKYSRIYEEIGCTTVRYSPSSDDLVDANVGNVSRKLLEVVIDMNLCDNPVLFHVFGNGGCKIFNSMRDELSSNIYFEDIVKLGVVYDSAPGTLSISQQINSICGNQQPSLWGKFYKLGLYVYYSLGYRLARLLGQMWRETMYEKMMFYQDGCSEIYLYSKADEIVLAEDIDTMIERRRMQGIDITAVCWDDSPHVEHLLVHRESYIKNCLDFLSKCIKLAVEDDEIESDGNM